MEEPEAGRQAEPEGPALTIGAAARRLCVAVETLRSWELRYGLGPGRRTRGSHRRYAAEDMRRLEEFCHLVGAGAAAPEAARAVLAGYTAAGHDTRAGNHEPGADAGDHGNHGNHSGRGNHGGHRNAGIREDGGAEAEGEDGGERGERGDGAKDSGHAGGGRTLPVGRAGSATARGLARSAVRLDAAQTLDLLETVLAREGVAEAWESTIAPALLAVGRKWTETSGRYVEVEHLLSWCVGVALHRRVPEPGVLASGRRAVLLACAPGEWHSLPLEVLRAALAEREVPTCMLGAAVPLEALGAAVRRIAPAHVVIWSQSPLTADPACLAAARPGRGTALAAGPGWRGARLAVPGMLPTLAEALRACAG